MTLTTSSRGNVELKGGKKMRMPCHEHLVGICVPPHRYEQRGGWGVICGDVNHKVPEGGVYLSQIPQLAEVGEIQDNAGFSKHSCWS